MTQSRTQIARILAALCSGASTSHEIASLLGADRRRIAVALCGLANVGAIKRAGVVNADRIGRPYVKWRLA